MASNSNSGNNSEKIRLNKYIADAGVTSRRGADSLIEAGRVKVNGKRITELGFKVDLKSKVEVDGETIVLTSDRKSTRLNSSHT